MKADTRSSTTRLAHPRAITARRRAWMRSVIPLATSLMVVSGFLTVRLNSAAKIRAESRSTKDLTLDDDEPSIDIGQVRAILPDESQEARSAAEALKGGRHPERLSALIQPEFDPAEFEQDPQAYLEGFEPGRVFRTAQPGANVPVLLRISPGLVHLVQGESCTLRVQGPPRAPVTFTSFDLGAFKNKLNSITVQADADGIAAAEFFATPGTIADVNILAGSPLASGQVRFVIEVLFPDEER